MLRPANFQAATRTPSPPSASRPKQPRPLRQTLLPLESRSTDRIIPDRIPFPPSLPFPHYPKATFSSSRSKHTRLTTRPHSFETGILYKLYIIAILRNPRHIAFPDKFEVIANYERHRTVQEFSLNFSRFILELFQAYFTSNAYKIQMLTRVDTRPCLSTFTYRRVYLSFSFFPSFSTRRYPVVSGKIASESIPEVDVQGRAVERRRQGGRDTGWKGWFLREMFRS